MEFDFSCPLPFSLPRLHHFRSWSTRVVRVGRLCGSPDPTSPLPRRKCSRQCLGTTKSDHLASSSASRRWSFQFGFVARMLARSLIRFHHFSSAGVLVIRFLPSAVRRK